MKIWAVERAISRKKFSAGEFQTRVAKVPIQDRGLESLVGQVRAEQRLHRCLRFHEKSQFHESFAKSVLTYRAQSRPLSNSTTVKVMLVWVSRKIQRSHELFRFKGVAL